MKKTVVFICLLWAAGTRAYAQNVYGALAIDRSNGFYYGWAYDYASLKGAKNRATKECTEKGGNCTVVLTWQGKGCAAYRTIPGQVGTAYGWGLGTTKEQADAIAIREAQKRSKSVYPDNFVWACNSVGEFKEIENPANNIPAATSTTATTPNKLNAKTKKLTGLKDVDGNEYEYEGEVLNNMPNGMGTATYIKNGSVYTGMFKNGKANGPGKYKWASGAHYEGDFVNDKMQGKGTYTFRDGNTYVGELFNSKMHGYGVWRDVSTGSTYTGTYKNNKMHGTGTLAAGPDQELIYTPKTVKYIGSFVESDRNGYGKCYDKNNKLIYSGNFSNDKPTGTYPSQ